MSGRLISRDLRVDERRSGCEREQEACSWRLASCSVLDGNGPKTGSELSSRAGFKALEGHFRLLFEPAANGGGTIKSALGVMEEKVLGWIPESLIDVSPKARDVQEQGHWASF